MRAFLSKLLWYPKQLLPLRYHTNFWKNGKHYHCDWNMYLGRCYNIQTVEI